MPELVELASEGPVREPENLLRASFICETKGIPWEKYASFDTFHHPCRFYNTILAEFSSLFRGKIAGYDMGCCCLPVEILEEASPVADYEAVEIIERGLCIAVYMSDDPSKDGRLVGG